MIDEGQRESLIRRCIHDRRPPVRAECLRCAVYAPGAGVDATFRGARKQPGGTLVLWKDCLVFLAHRGASVLMVLVLILALLALIAVCTWLSVRSGRQLWFIPMVGAVLMFFAFDRFAKRRLDMADPAWIRRAVAGKDTVYIALRDVVSVDVLPAKGFLDCTALRVTFRDSTGRPAGTLVAMPQQGSLGGKRDFPASQWRKVIRRSDLIA